MLKTTATAALLIFGTGLACSTNEAGNQTCDSMEQGQLQDECFHDQLMSTAAANIELVIELANKIEDPIIRGAAIFRWIETHNREIPRERGRALCEILSDREKTSCERRLYSAHLQR